MPHISIESGALSDVQKEQLVASLTKTAAEIMQIPDQFFSVTIHELPDKNYGIGGRTIDQVKAEYRNTNT